MKEQKSERKLEKSREKWRDENVRERTKITEDNVAEVIAKWTNIPVTKISQDENEKLRNLEEELHKRVVGQAEAIEAVAKAIRRGRVRNKRSKSSNRFVFISRTNWSWKDGDIKGTCRSTIWHRRQHNKS